MNNGTESLNDLFDPWGMFRRMRDTYLESSAKSMVDFVNTEEYAQASGALLSTYLEYAEPLRAWMDKVMPQVLASYGLPSRKELLSVATRLNSIEMRMDDIQADLDEIRHALSQDDTQQCNAA